MFYPIQWNYSNLNTHSKLVSFHSLTENITVLPMSYLKRPFPSSLVPLFQNESECETFLMILALICIKMNL